MTRALAGADLRAWSTGALFAVIAHLAIAIGLMPRHPDSALDAGAPVVMVEFAPEVTSPVQSASEPDQGQPQPEPESVAQAARERRQDPMEQQPPPQNDQISMLQLSVPRPDVQPPEPQEARPDSPAPSAPPAPQVIGPRMAAPAPGQVTAVSSKQLATWQLKLVSHLEQFKRYPREARPAQGTVNVAFTIDRQGHVVDARVVKSSGSGPLDAAAIAMIRRAEPLPAPPPNAPESQLSQVVPVRFVSDQRG